MSDYVYRMTNLKDSSERYGCCDKCGNHADTMYLLTEKKVYFSFIKNGPSLTHSRMVFGHKACLAGETVKRTVKIPYVA